MNPKRQERPVRNNPGIYKRFEFNSSSQKWIDTGKYRSLRRVFRNGRSRKEQAVFNNIEDAKAFRAGLIDKSSGGSIFHKVSADDKKDSFSFEDLVLEWKSFHYLTLEKSTRQTYDKLLPHLDYLKTYTVSKIDPALIDHLVQIWVRTYAASKKRQSFGKELDLLKTILGFYKSRRNLAFMLPVLNGHYKAADIAKKAEAPVASLSQEDLGRFLGELRNGRTPQYYPLALAQFCMGLRIGKACGLTWEAIDLKNKVARIECTITWDQWSWKPEVKLRPKNGKVRILVIPDVLFEEFSRVKAKRDPDVTFVFHKEGQPLNRKTIGVAYNRALKRLGITNVSGTHMLRKTAATQANKATGDFYAVSKLMDHSSPNVTLRYVSQTNAQKQKMANALNDVLKGAEGAIRTMQIGPEDKPHPTTLETPVPQRPLNRKRGILRLVENPWEKPNQNPQTTDFLGEGILPAGEAEKEADDQSGLVATAGAADADNEVQMAKDRAEWLGN